MPTGRVQPVNADGSFRPQNVAGPFLFRLDALPDGWMLKASCPATWSILPGSPLETAP